MKMNYIRKSFLIMFTLFAPMLFSVVCNAETTVEKQITSVANFTSIDPVVTHTAIETVLANGILNAKVNTLFGDATAADLVLEYQLSSGETGEIKKENIVNKRDYFLGTPEGTVTKDTDYVDYRIKGVFQVEGEDFVVYAPEGASSSTFVRANVVSIIEQPVDGSTGGKIEVFCGDQSKGDKGTVVVSVPEGAYSGEHNVIVDFLAESESSSDPSSKGKQNILSTLFVDVEDVLELEKAVQISNLPLQTKAQASKFSMQYQEGTEWENAPSSKLSVDKSYQLYSFSATDLGFYRVIESLVL